jgi:hypothetical protein
MQFLTCAARRTCPPLPSRHLPAVVAVIVSRWRQRQGQPAGKAPPGRSNPAGSWLGCRTYQGPRCHHRNGPGGQGQGGRGAGAGLALQPLAAAANTAARPTAHSRSPGGAAGAARLAGPAAAPAAAALLAPALARLALAPPPARRGQAHRLLRRVVARASARTGRGEGSRRVSQAPASLSGTSGRCCSGCSARRRRRSPQLASQPPGSRCTAHSRSRRRSYSSCSSRSSRQLEAPRQPSPAGPSPAQPSRPTR